MKNLKSGWKTISSGLSDSQKAILLAIAGTGVLILVGFLILLAGMFVKGKSLYSTESRNTHDSLSREVLFLPSGSVVENVAYGDGNIILKLRINRDEFLYFYTSGSEHPEKIIKFEREM